MKNAMYLIPATILTVCPMIALAHAYLVSSEPVHHSTLETTPTQLTLRFSERLETHFVRVLLKHNGQIVPGLRTTAQADHKTIVIKTGISDAGEYKLDWSIVARDGHPTHGRLDFIVKP